MALRSVILPIHRWFGLIAGVFLIVLGVTGSLLVFEDAIDRAFNPATSFVQPGAARLGVDSLMFAAKTAWPGQVITGVRLPERTDLSMEFSTATGQSLFIDPYSARPLGERNRATAIARKIHQLHTQLLSGSWAKWIVGTASFAGMILAIGGLILWWPRKIFRVTGGGASWRRVNFDLHNLMGICSSLVLFVVTASGVFINQSKTLEGWVIRTFNSAPIQAAPRASTVIPGGTPVSPDSALRSATRAVPGAVPTIISLPTSPQAIYRISLKHSDDHTPAGRSRVAIDQFSGAVLQALDTHTAQPGTRYVNLNRSIHTGDVWGTPTRVLWFLASLILVCQTVSGFMIWYKPKRPAA